MSSSEYDPNSSGEEWSGAEAISDNESENEGDFAPAISASALNNNAAAGGEDSEEEENDMDGLTDNVQTGQQQNQRDLQKRGVPPLFHSQHAVAQRTQSLTCVAKPYGTGHACGAALVNSSSSSSCLAEGAVIVTFAFVSPETFNVMYATALPKSRLKKLPSAVCVWIASMNATAEEAADISKFYMAMAFPSKYTMVVARPCLLADGAHGHTCLALRAGRVFVKTYRPTICEKPTRFEFHDVDLAWKDIHERTNHADTNTEMAQLVRHTATKVLAVPQGTGQSSNATRTNELLKVCTVGHLLLRTQKQARDFVDANMKKGEAKFFVSLGRPDGQKLQRKKLNVSDPSLWPTARLEVKGEVTVRSVILALASRDYPPLFQLLSGLDDVYVNIALAALHYKLLSSQTSIEARAVQTNKIVTYASRHYRVDADGRIYPKTGWWAFKASNISRMLSSTDTLRESDGRLVCGPLRDIGIAFVFRLRRPITIATTTGPRTFTQIVLTGRGINVMGTQFSAIQIIWNNILQNGLLPLLQSCSGHLLSPRDIRKFFREYTVGTMQMAGDRLLGDPSTVRIILFAGGRPLRTLPKIDQSTSLRYATEFRLVKAAPRDLPTKVECSLQMHDGHGKMLYENLHLQHFRVGRTVETILTQKFETIWTCLGDDYNLFFIENLNAANTPDNTTITFRRGAVSVGVICQNCQVYSNAIIDGQYRMTTSEKLPLGEYLADRDSTMKLHVVDRSYNTETHGGGTLALHVCGLRATTHFKGQFASDDEIRRIILQRKVAFFKNRSGPAKFKDVWEKDVERKADGTIARRVSPLDPDTCLLREDITMMPSRELLSGELWNCLVDIQVLSGHRPWAMSGYARGYRKLQATRLLLGEAQAKSMTLGTQDPDPCGIFPSSLKGSVVPYMMSWQGLGRHCHYKFQCNPQFPKPEKGTFTATPRVVGNGVVWVDRVYGPRAGPMGHKWIGDFRGSPASLESADDLRLYRELFPTQIYFHENKTIGHEWGGIPTTLLPCDAKMLHVRSIWREGRNSLTYQPDLSSMLKYMRLALRLRYNLRGRLGSSKADQILSDLETHPEVSTGQMTSIRQWLSTGANIIQSMKEQVPTCCMEGKATLATTTLLKKLREKGATNWAFLWTKRKRSSKEKSSKKEAKAATASSPSSSSSSAVASSFSCPTCLGGGCGECGHSGKKTVVFEDGIEEVSAALSPLAAYEKAGGEVVVLE